jgi:hypothetical protein
LIGPLLLVASLCIGPDAATAESVHALIRSALWQTRVTAVYDPSYVKISYPGGDVPIDRGVCADVIVRSFRSTGLDLQQLIHEDMRRNFGEYPKNWGLRKPDANIDHRRVPNIATFLTRKGKSLPITRRAEDYVPGDIVTWRIPGNRDHIGIVVNVPVAATRRHRVVHNIGSGSRLEDVLFAFPITGHYRYFAPPQQ